MRPHSAGVRRLFGFLTRSAHATDPPARAHVLIAYSRGGSLHRTSRPTNVSTVQRGSTKRGLGGYPVSGPVCSHEYPYVGFFRCPTTAFRTFTSSHSSWSEQSS